MIVRALASCLALAVVACGGGGGSQSATTMIVASEGGTVELSGSETRLEIPAGALAEDTEVTVSIGSLDAYGPLEHGRDDVLVIEPEGLLLEVPADITIDPSDAVPGDASVALRQFTDGGWHGTDGAPAHIGSGGLVYATILALAPTALVVEDAPEGPVGDVRGQVLHLYTEAPLPGITFTLIADDQVVDTAVSDADGRFTFADAAVGTYSVHADVAPDDNCFSDPTDKDVTVVEQGVDLFFGFVPGPCATGRRR